MKANMIIPKTQYILTAVAILGLILLCSPNTSLAHMPPHPDVQEKIDRGEIQMPFTTVDEAERPAHMQSQTGGPVKTPAATGTWKALCILVDFSDNTAAVAPEYFDTLIFNNSSGSVRHFYQENSYGQLDMTTDQLPSVAGWVRAPQTYDYYVDNNYGTDSPYPNNSLKMCEDVVDLVDASVDFSDYDNDGDNYVDLVIIVHAGRGAEYTGNTTDMWSHKWSISPRLKDGVYVYNYTVVPEYWVSPGDMTIGVIAHELGHAFGLPDLYDRDYSSQGVGKWSIMAAGSWNGSLGSSPSHFDAWSKIQLGWVTPTVITTNQNDLSIPQVETNQSIYKVWATGEAGDEYYLVENRQRTGYDATLPGDGLLIWHVDDDLSHNDNEWYPGHSSFGHYRVALEQADGFFQLEQNTSSGNSGDPYPGAYNIRTFNDASTPGSESYDGSGSFVAITDVSSSGATMTADFAVTFSADADDDNPVLPQFELAQNYPNPFNPVTRIDFTLDTATDVNLTVFNVLGEKVTTLVDDYYTAGNHSTVWDGTADTGHRVVSGVYFYRLISDDNRQVKKMLLVK